MARVGKKAPAVTAPQATANNNSEPESRDEIPPMASENKSSVASTPKARALFSFAKGLESLDRVKTQTRGFGEGSRIVAEKIDQALALVAECKPTLDAFPDYRVERTRRAPEPPPVKIGEEYFILKSEIELYSTVVLDIDESLKCIEIRDTVVALMEQVVNEGKPEEKRKRFPIAMAHLQSLEEAEAEEEDES